MTIPLEKGIKLALGDLNVNVQIKEVMIMWGRAIFIVLYLLIFFPSCKSPTSSDEDRIMILYCAGTVTNARTGLPIINALVEVVEYNASIGEFQALNKVRTDEGGHYSIRPSVDKQYNESLRLRASAEGYRKLTIYELYTIKKTTDVQIADFQLQPL